MKILIALAITGIAGGILVYVFVYNKPHPDYETLNADFSITAKQLYEEFVNEPQTTGNKYNGKILDINGTISSIETNDSASTIVFVFNQGDFGDEGVRVSLLGKFLDQSKTLSKGSTVSLKGFCTGFNDTDVVIEKGSISQN